MRQVARFFLGVCLWLGGVGATSPTFDYVIHPADATGLLVPVPSLPKPAKGAWVTNAVFGTVFRRITDTSQDGVGSYLASVVYSRWTPLNSSREYLYLQRAVGGRDALIYSAVSLDLLKILPDEIVVDGNAGQAFESMEGAEIRWDYSGLYPQRFYYCQGAAFYEYDVRTDRARLKHDFTREFPGVDLVHNGVEGDASADSRYWAFMVKGPYAVDRYPLRAVVAYDQQAERIVGQMTVQEYRQLGGRYDELPTPNMVEISPSGSKLIYHLSRCWGERRQATNWTLHADRIYWTPATGVADPIGLVEEPDAGQVYGVTESMPQEAGTYWHDRDTERLYLRRFDESAPGAQAIYWEYGIRPQDVGTFFDGPHAWNLDFTQPVKVSVDESHSGWAWGYDGQELFVSQNNRNDWIEAYDIKTGSRMQCLFHGDFGWNNGWHFARMPRSTPGWVLMSTYCPEAEADWGDNQVFMLEMRDRTEGARVWRLGPTHNRYDEYYAEGFAAMSPFGDRFWWGAKWPGQTNIETYEMVLPLSWHSDIAGGPLAAPTDLAASVEAGGIRLSWQDRSPNESGFRVERRSAASTEFVVAGQVGRDAASFTDAQASGAGPTTYRVRAFNATHESAYSNEVKTSEIPASSFGIRVMGLVASGQMEIRWPSRSDRHYSVWLAADPAGPYARSESALPGSSPTNTYRLPVLDEPARYLRIREDP